MSSHSPALSKHSWVRQLAHVGLEWAKIMKRVAARRIWDMDNIIYTKHMSFISLPKNTCFITKLTIIFITTDSQPQKLNIINIKPIRIMHT